MTTSRFFCGSWNYTPSTTRWRNLKTGRFILKMNQTFFVHTTPEKLKPNNQWSLWICFWRKLRKSHDYWLSWFHRFRIASRSKYSCSAAQFWREIVLSGAFIGRNRGEWLTTGLKFLVRRRNTWSNVFFLYTWLFLLSRKEIKWKLTGYSGKYLVPFMVSTVKDNPSMRKEKSVFQVTCSQAVKTMCLELASIYEGSRIFVFIDYSSLRSSLV